MGDLSDAIWRELFGVAVVPSRGVVASQGSRELIRDMDDYWPCGDRVIG